MHKSDNEFIISAKKLLQDFAISIESLDENDELEVDFLDEVLTIESEKGQFIINYNCPLQQIWLSSPISGPHHFSYINNSWVNRNKSNIHDLINEEMSMVLAKLHA